MDSLKGVISAARNPQTADGNTGAIEIVLELTRSPASAKFESLPTRLDEGAPEPGCSAQQWGKPVQVRRCPATVWSNKRPSPITHLCPTLDYHLRGKGGRRMTATTTPLHRHYHTTSKPVAIKYSPYSPTPCQQAQDDGCSVTAVDRSLSPEPGNRFRDHSARSDHHNPDRCLLALPGLPSSSISVCLKR